MAESLFDIFGDILKQTNIVRQPISNVENIGVSKKSSGPLKPQSVMKPIKETKKSFLNNAGTRLPVFEAATPRRSALASRPLNVPTTPATSATLFMPDDLAFTKPLYRYDNLHSDVLDHLPLWEPTPWSDSPKHQVAPTGVTHSMEFDDSCPDEFFSDDLSDISINAEDLSLPDLY
ncbi:hypothetical protein EVAR_77803_1 [Eumeta japonica]|uniref:Uncharacterized protein n=1 Tax=Eumeta variegata TaxID=151549 RepID=A0A4C1TC51_EUMVA|nr:hypothetical protein EVAR_77803_1 [Eumeta japonica]